MLSEHIFKLNEQLLKYQTTSQNDYNKLVVVEQQLQLVSSEFEKVKNSYEQYYSLWREILFHQFKKSPQYQDQQLRRQYSSGKKSLLKQQLFCSQELLVTTVDKVIKQSNDEVECFQKLLATQPIFQINQEIQEKEYTLSRLIEINKNLNKSEQNIEIQWISEYYGFTERFSKIIDAYIYLIGKFELKIEQSRHTSSSLSYGKQLNFSSEEIKETKRKSIHSSTDFESKSCIQCCQF